MQRETTRWARARIGQLEAKIVGQSNGYRKVILAFNREESDSFLRAATQLFEAQMKDPSCEPPFLLIDETGDSIRTVTQECPYPPFVSSIVRISVWPG